MSYFVENVNHVEEVIIFFVMEKSGIYVPVMFVTL